MTPLLSTEKTGQMTKSRVAALVSGGLDSSVMLGELARTHDEVMPVYVRCGLRWEGTEIAVLRDFISAMRNEEIAPLEVLDVPMGDVYRGHWSTGARPIPGYYEPDEDWEIPGRNLILIAKTAVWCQLRDVHSIALGSLKSNRFSDATPEFFDHLQKALCTALKMDLTLLRPQVSLHKADIIRLGESYPLELTLSCADPVGRAHCGQCGKCRERINAFADANVVDRTKYVQRVGK